MKTVCCVCNRTKSANGWVKNTTMGEKLSHGFCPRCYQRTLKQVAHHFRQPMADGH